MDMKKIILFIFRFYLFIRHNVEDNQTGEKPGDIWRSGRTQMDFMPVDSDLMLKVLGSWQPGYRAFIGVCR